jgi:acyl-CoA thioesterase FadM
LFATETEIRISDINYGGHLGNDRLLTFAHDARIKFLKQFNYTENNIENLGIIMNDAALVFKSEGFLGNRIKIEIGLADISRAGCDFIYKMTNLTTNKILALVKTGIVFFDYSERKVKQIPGQFLNRIYSKQ